MEVYGMVKIKVIVKGDRIVPRFYLPVCYLDYRQARECWILPVAPFALLIVTLKRAFVCFWCGCIETVDGWKK